MCKRRARSKQDKIPQQRAPAGEAHAEKYGGADVFLLKFLEDGLSDFILLHARYTAMVSVID